MNVQHHGQKHKYNEITTMKYMSKHINAYTQKNKNTIKISCVDYGTRHKERKMDTNTERQNDNKDKEKATRHRPKIQR